MSEITYPTVANSIMKKILAKGIVRSNDLVKGINDYSNAVVYITLKNLQAIGLIEPVTDRKKFREYSLTKEGLDFIETEVSKSKKEIIDVLKQTDDPKAVTIEMLTERLFQNLPKDDQKESIKIWLKHKITEEFDDMEQRVVRDMEKIYGG